MSEQKDSGRSSSSEKVTRRNALAKMAAAAAGAAIVVGAGAYYAGGGGAQKPTEITKILTETMTATGTETAAVTTASAADIVLQRAIDGMNSLKSAGKIPPGASMVIAAEEGFQVNGITHAVESFYNLAPFKRSDFDVRVVGIPFANLYEKLSSEAVSKTGAYDVLWGVVTWFFADLVEAGIYKDLTDYLAKYDPDKAMRNSFYGVVRDYQGMAKGKYYALASDGDVFMYHYRKDLFANPEEKDAFKSKYGYELKPALDWKEFRDEAEFFTRKAGETLAGQKLENDFSGFVEWRMKFVTYEWFWARFCTLVDDPAKVYLDPETLEPGIIINKDDAITVLEYMKDIDQFLPEGALGAWGYGEELVHFSNGNAAMWVTWSNGGKIPDFPGRSKIVGKVTSTTVPIYKHERYYMASGYSAGVSQYGKNPELAYLIDQALHSPTLVRELVCIADTNVDPFTTQVFEDPQLLAGKWCDFDFPNARPFMEVLAKSLMKGFPELAVPGNAKFGEAFETNLQTYLAGQISADKCVENTAKEWRSLIDTTGKDRIKEYYLPLTKAMPP